MSSANRIIIPGAPAGRPGQVSLASDPMAETAQQAMERMHREILKAGIEGANTLGLQGKRITGGQIVVDPAAAVRGQFIPSLQFKWVRDLYSWEDNRYESS